MEYTPRLKKDYEDRVTKSMIEKFNYKNIMQVPKLTKVCLSQGIGNAVSDKKLVDAAVEEMTTITGQKAMATFSKKDISNFKLRKGMPIGAKVTLRGEKMWEFVDRFVAISLPRTRDFRGVESKGFDGRGNYTLGIKEQIIFPEIDYEKIDSVRGLDIAITTSAKNDDEARLLLQEFNFPFRR